MLYATVLLVGFALASPLPAPQFRGQRPGAGCAAYEIIAARGTTESQRNPMGERAFVSGIMRAVPGGKKYEAVYPASFETITVGPSIATRDMVKHLDQQAQACPGQPFVLFGYSQGAMSIVTLMNDRGFQKHAPNMAASVLYGNPYWTRQNAGDTNAGTARTGRGTFGNMKSVPQPLRPATRDYCNKDDLFCAGGASLLVHLSYAQSPASADSVKFSVERLQAVLGAKQNGAAAAEPQAA
ncbi:cutinase [Protomyces lactucae-debilis]|uniref:Cutinase n=1 Tax=Protomyces lactucae-debilis TaxID=2754530 RepID=A0A1Y2FLN4_PROLT|nr:cutinase [Protomyces lactucae-debilis]ORY84487.1 cutinase [Protomyces lactucae-debilis]